ncbi:MAG: hypothetical protein K6T61_12440 [Bryobacteraceae bacterium]|nr:hypothetical protein [Bryobacteraceae bacterium]
MKITFAAGLALLTLAIAVAPLAAQTYRMEAAIPFAFAVGSHTMPAGQYEIQNLARGVAKIYNPDSRKPLAVSYQPGAMPSSKMGGGEVILVFHRYDEAYFLAEIRDGYTATVYSFPEAQRQRELRRAAAMGKPDEILTVVARANFGAR